MTRVTCPKCNHTFDIDDSGYSSWSTGPVWTKYSNPHGLCECDCCHELSDKVYVQHVKQNYYKHTPDAFCMIQPSSRAFCKNCISNFLSRRQLLEIERDGYTY